ncbi:MAG: hypothetical protein DRH15_02550, partial [Deltaproteobacteria bacterium]
EFCTLVGELARVSDPHIFVDRMEGYQISERELIGDLMGAIYGIRYTGFIGEVYKLYPFPKMPEAFKQQPEGYKNRKAIEYIIKEFGNQIDIEFIATTRAGNVKIGEYEFSRLQFLELVRYVWQGGYPGWRDEVRPEYVMRMKEEIEESRSGFFNGIIF